MQELQSTDPEPKMEHEYSKKVNVVYLSNVERPCLKAETDVAESCGADQVRHQARKS